MDILSTLVPQRTNATAHGGQESCPCTSLAALADLGAGLDAPADTRLDAARERGRALCRQRQGRLAPACSDCHETMTGRRPGGSPIPEAHPIGDPLHRLEWQGLGALQRRLRACVSGVRAEPFAWGAPQWVELELYLAWRARHAV